MTTGGLSHAAAAELPAVEALDDRTDKPTPACARTASPRRPGKSIDPQDPGPGNDPQDLEQAGAAELPAVEVARPAPPAEV